MAEPSELERVSGPPAATCTRPLIDEKGSGWKKASKYVGLVRLYVPALAPALVGSYLTNALWSGNSWTNWCSIQHHNLKVRASQGFKTLRDMVPEDCLVFNERLHRKRALGEGGFAFVELAELDGCKPVAVKTLKPELLPSEGDVRLFLSETALMRKLRHESIVEMIGIGGSPENAVITNSTKSSLAGISSSSDQIIPEGVVDGPQPLSELYIVQEFCAGGSLRDLVFKQMGQGPKKLYSKLDALRWMLQIAKALKYMHSAKPKVIHRDLKLDNVLLTDSNPHAANVKLADFGLARALTASRPSSASSSSQLLQRLLSTPVNQLDAETQQRGAKLDVALKSMSLDGYIKGIPRQLSRQLTRTLGKQDSVATVTHDLTGEAGSYSYMAPEVLKREQYNEKADIFSFACCVYNVFYRNIPSVMVLATTSMEDEEALTMYAWKVANGWRPDLKTGSVPEEINKLIDECWSGVPELRPSAQEIVDILEDIEARGICAEEVKPAGGGCCTVM